MNKKEFIALMEARTEEGAQKFTEIMSEFADKSKDEEIEQALLSLNILKSVEKFMEDWNNNCDEPIWEKPFTLDNAIEALEASVVYKFIDTLEE